MVCNKLLMKVAGYRNTEFNIVLESLLLFKEKLQQKINIFNTLIDFSR